MPAARRGHHPQERTALARQQPYFLVGSPRSGTTLLRLLLGHHPALTACEEFEFVAPFVKAAAPGWPCLDRYRRALPERFDVRLGNLLPLPTATTFPALAEALLWRLSRADDTRRIGATVHHDFEHLPRLWPDAQFVHLVRDPRDVTRSCAKMGWFGNAHGAVSMWRAAQRSWQRLAAAVPAERRLLVQFEALVADPVAELTRICTFLGIDFDPRMLEIEADTTYRRPDPRHCRSWRTSMSARDIRAVEAELGAELQAAGYQPSNLPPLRLTWLRRAHLRFDNRWGRIRAAQRRYGYLLWLGRVAANRLPWPGLRRYVQRRWDAITLRHLR
ncbi:MAG: sulfotransferase [Planctomycetes bacterium]|nr:sulfotransferase [Planctomycetota bacterium]